MTSAEETRWIEPYKGFRYRTRQTTITTTSEHRLIGICGIDPGVFGRAADPAAFISLAINEGVQNGIHANGTVNMVQRLIQHEPLPLDEPITIDGMITDVEDVPRGKVATSETWFSLANGRRAITAARKSLRPDASKPPSRGAGQRPQTVIDDPLTLPVICDVTLTPEMVKGYGADGVNPIHTEPEAAKRAGFRAPIIGGGMGVRYLTAEIWRRFAPSEIDLDIYFRRPIFWDDTVTLRVAGDSLWTAICLERDGKVATEARINRLVPKS